MAMEQPPFLVAPVRTPADLDAVGELFDAYAASLDVDLAYQNYGAERAGLPGKYAPPEGELLLARSRDGAAIGCVALRAVGDGACEMKRLYVAPGARGLGLGRRLAEAVVQAAGARGYREIRLDTLPSMASAIGLYEAMGFTRVAPYYAGAVDGTIFLARPLAG